MIQALALLDACGQHHEAGGGRGEQSRDDRGRLQVQPPCEQDDGRIQWVSDAAVEPFGDQVTRALEAEQGWILPRWIELTPAPQEANTIEQEIQGGEQ